MMTAAILRLPRPALAGVAALLLAGACGGDVQGPLDDRNVDGSTELLSTLIVSNTVTSDPGAGARLALSGFSSSEEIVFVSLPPGSVLNGETAVIQTRRTEARATASMVDGGFDPIPLAAGTGDTLDIRIELANGGAPLVFFSVVPPSIPPVIVRTDPPPKKRDVPLNAVMLVVFSEPIDPATLTASSVRLLLDGVPVAGTLEFEDDANLTLTFTPAEPLAPDAEYTLLITQEIDDLDGEALEAPHTSAFSTVAAQGGGGSLWVIVANQSGVCIVGATVEVVGGQRLGQSLTQTIPCNVWGYDGGVLFEGLTAGVEMTLRASASGYVAQEKTVVSSFEGRLEIVLDRAEPPATGTLWVMVVDQSGVCIVGATVEVVGGQRLGQSLTQTTPCNVWAYDGGVLFEGLTAGVEMTLRASAGGYVAQEKTVVVPGFGTPQQAVTIVLEAEPPAAQGMPWGL